MFKRFAILLATIPLLLCGCEQGSFTTFLSNEYPKVVYHEDSWTINNVTIELKDGLSLNRGSAYDWIETEQGYDLVLHFVEGKE